MRAFAAPVTPGASRKSAVTESNSSNVLLVGVSAEEAGRIAPFLGRSGFEVDRFPSPEGALALIEQIPFELLVVRFPLEGMNALELLRKVRKEGSACLHSPLILLAAGEEQRSEANFYVGFGANRVLGVEDPEERVHAILSELLDIAPRLGMRIPVELEVRVGDGLETIACETRNLSASGMLLAVDLELAAGDRAAFELMLPGHSDPVRGQLEVVRKTRPDREEAGIGVRIVAFSGSGRDRLHAFVDAQR